MRRENVVKKISEILHKIAPDCKSMIYGSEARGDARIDSDIDVLVIVPDSQKDFSDRKIAITESLYDVELESGIIISPLVVLKSIWERMKTPFTCNVESEGILI